MPATAEIRSKHTHDDSDFRRKIASSKQEVSSFSEAFASLEKKILGAFSVREVLRFTTTLATSLVDVSHTADRLSVGTDELQAMGLAAEMAGGDAELLERMLGKMNVSAGKIASDKKLQQAFDELGINWSKFAELDPAERLLMLSRAFADASDSTAAYNAVMEVFGERVGRRATAVLRDFANISLPQVIARYKELGIVVDETTVKVTEQTEKFGKVWLRAFKGEVAESLGFWMQKIAGIRASDTGELSGKKANPAPDANVAAMAANRLYGESLDKTLEKEQNIANLRAKADRLTVEAEQARRMGGDYAKYYTLMAEANKAAAEAKSLQDQEDQKAAQAQEKRIAAIKREQDMLDRAGEIRRKRELDALPIAERRLEIARQIAELSNIEFLTPGQKIQLEELRNEQQQANKPTSQEKQRAELLAEKSLIAKGILPLESGNVEKFQADSMMRIGGSIGAQRDIAAGNRKLESIRLLESIDKRLADLDRHVTEGAD